MLKIILAGVRAHLLRLVLTGVAVALGVGFLTGALAYADTAKAGYFADLARPATNVDVAVRPVGPDGKLTDRSVEAIRTVPGVVAVDARTIAPLGLLAPTGRVINNFGKVGLGVSAESVPELAMYRLTEGRAVAGLDEALIDTATAAANGYAVGGMVTVVDAKDKPHRLTVVGLADFGSSARFRYRSVVVAQAGPLTQWTGSSGYQEIAVTTAGDPGDLRQRIATALPDAGVEVVTGDALRAELATSGAKYTDGFLDTLLAATIVALAVCCLVIYNTFSMLVAQRIRELALLRCVGASRGQLVRVILAESAVLGLCGAIAGVGLGIGLGWLLLTGRNTVGQGMVDHPLVVSPLTIGAGLAVGLFATVASSVLPAIWAARVAPLAALRQAADPPAAGRAAKWVRIAAAALLAAGGVVIARSGLGQGFTGTPRVVAGAMVVFVALVILVPLAAGPLIAVLGWLPGKVFGPTTRLAVANARRNPRRVAATTTALMIGVALLSLLSVILETAREQADREVAENFPVDFVLSVVARADEKPPLPAKLAPDLASRPEFGVVGTARSAAAWVAGKDTRVAAIAPGDLGTRLRPEIEAGDLAALKPGTVALRQDTGLTVGSVVEVSADSGQRLSLTVVAIYDDSPTDGDALLDWTDFSTLIGPEGGERILIRRSDSVTAPAARTTLDTVLRGYPLIYVESVADWRESLTATLERRLRSFSGLLGMSTLIAVFGIVNTMSLAVLERRRESATLRALGLTKRRLRATFLVEALLIAALAALVGLAFGVGSGWISARALLETYGHGSPAIPATLLAGYAGLAAAAGALAAVLPARRAARGSIAAALTDE